MKKPRTNKYALYDKPGARGVAARITRIITRLSKGELTPSGAGKAIREVSWASRVGATDTESRECIAAEVERRAGKKASDAVWERL